MKISILLSIVLYLLSTVNAQNNNERIVTETMTNGHSISKSKELYYVDDEKEPFTGKYITYGYKDELKKEANYKKGKLNGAYIEYTKRESQYVSLKVNYIDNKKVGEYIEYCYPNQKKLECFYNQKGELQGMWISYFGFAKEEPEKVGKFTNGKADSTWVTYYQGGKIRFIETYKLGDKNGVNIEYYENGKKKSEQYFLNNSIEGKILKWYEDGTLMRSDNIKNGNYDGSQYEYYINGKIKSEENYENGKKKGKFIWYNQDGSIKEQTEFK